MTKNDLNKRRIEGERHEAAYQALERYFGEIEQDIVEVRSAAWDDSETCRCGKTLNTASIRIVRVASNAYANLRSCRCATANSDSSQCSRLV